MKKWIKTVIALLLLTVLCAIGIFGVIKLQEYKRMKAEEQKALEIKLAYQKFNRSVYLAVGEAGLLEYEGIYKAPPTTFNNPYGIHPGIYVDLLFYRKDTGKTLTYETFIAYWSQEFEPDGSLRLYNNGLHPEIEAYITWIGEVPKDSISKYTNRLRELYATYWSEHETNGFKSRSLGLLSPKMYDELAKKEADPNYEMDLLSLQQAGY